MSIQNALLCCSVLATFLACGGVAVEELGGVDEEAESPAGTTPDDGLDTRSQAIMNGIVQPNGAPLKGVVRVELWNPDLQRFRICSGQITSRNTLLTAGHCPEAAGMVGDTGTRTMRVFKSTPTSTTVALTNGSVTAKIRVHPDYVGGNNPNYKYDVAVIKAPSNWLSTVQNDAAGIMKGSNAFTGWALGYGNYGTDRDADYDEQLRGAQFSVSVDAQGYVATASAFDSPSLCIGDSGGPLKTSFFSGALTYAVASNVVGGNSDVCGPTAHWASTGNSWSWIRDRIAACTDHLSYISCW